MYQIVKVVIGFVLPIVATASASAQWQGLCPGGQWVPSGPGYMCVERAPTPMPRFDPEYRAAPPRDDIYNNPGTREALRLGSKIMGAQPLRQNIPLTSGLVQQEIYIPPAPRNYIDPFARPEIAAPTLSTGSYTITQQQLDYLRDNQVRMQPPQR